MNILNYIYTIFSIGIIHLIFNHFNHERYNKEQNVLLRKKNIVYLTKLEFTGIILYFIQFLYSYIEYFNDFINGFCLIISLFQIVENRDFRSFIPLSIFSTLYSFYNLSITFNLIKQQNEINKKFSHISLYDEIELDINKTNEIPCDIQILEGKNVVVNELEITGENIFIVKKSGDTIYRGTTLIDGKLKGIAINVGNDCCIYNIKPRNNKIKTKLYQKITKITFNNLYYLFIISSIIASFNLNEGFFNMFKNTALLLNTLVPLSLQSFYNTATFLFSKRIAFQNNVIINNHGIYSFHNKPKFIVTDKTGTITNNRLNVEQILNIGHKVSNYENFLNVLSCSEIVKHSITGMVLKTDELEYLLIKKYNFDIPKINRIIYHPFTYDLGIKYSVVKDDDGLKLHIQGIPEIVEMYCSKPFFSQSNELITKPDSNSYHRIICHTSKTITEEELERIQKGEIRTVLNHFEHLNIYVFSDYLTDNLKYSIQEILKTKHFSILTGDSLKSVEHICENLGINDGNIIYINGREISYESLKHIEKYNKVIVYRATPITKEFYIENLQKLGQVMMIGDGSNDIPAITRADIGVSVMGENLQVRNISDVFIDKWNKIPILLNSFSLYREKIKHIIKWVLSKHIISASILGTYFYLSNFYTKDPIHPFLMLSFNGILYGYMSFMCMYDNISERKKSYKEWIYQGIVYGILIGILTYSNVNNIYGSLLIISLKLMVMIKQL